MPKFIKLDEKEKVRLGTEIVQWWQDDSSDKAPWLTDLAKWLNAYQGRDYEKDVPYEGASNLHVPITATVIETIHPRMMAAITRPKPIVGFRPQEPEDHDLARSREEFLDWAMREEINIFPTLDRVILNTLINGIQFVKVTWDLQTRRLRDKKEFPVDTSPDEVLMALLEEDKAYADALQRIAGKTWDEVMKDRDIKLDLEKTDAAMYVYVDREDITYDAPRITFKNPEDININGNSPHDLQLADHIIERYWLTVDRIKREVRNGVFEATTEELDKLTNVASPDMDLDDNSADVKYEKEEVTGVKTTFRQGKPDEIELLDCYRKYDVDDDGYDEEVIVTVPKACPNIILRCVRLEEVFRHGLRPFVYFYFNPVADSIWSIGVPQILEGLQKEFDVIHNQRTDAGFIANTPFGVYVPAAGFNPEKMAIEPGYMYPVEDVNAVKWYAPPHNPAWGFQEESGLWALTERRMKVNDLSMGRIGDTQGAARTAAGVQALTAQQATGFDIYIRRFQESFKLLCQQVLALYQQYMPKGKKVRILGKQGDPDFTVTRQDILGNMDMEFTGNSLSTDRQIEREALTFLAQSVLSPNAIGMLLQLGISTPAGVAEWYRKLLGAFDITGLERIIQIPENTQPLTPDEVITKLIQGEDVKPVMGEDHQGIIAAIQQFMMSPDAVTIPAERRIMIQRHIQKRMAQAKQEQMMQMLQQMMMMSQNPMQQFGGLQAGGVGGAPTPPQPAKQGLAF